MGHSSIASTQIYAQITGQKIAKDMERLIKKYTVSVVNRRGFIQDPQ